MTLSNLLLYRLAILNFTGLALAFWAHTQDLVLPIFVADVSMLSYAIVALFAVGVVSTGVRAAKVSAAVNDLKAHGYADAYCQRKAAKMESKNAHIGDIAGWLMVLGLLGTVVGFTVALDGVANDASTEIMSGLRVAIGTTLIGGFLSLWLDVNRVILDGATAGYVEDVK